MYNLLCQHNLPTYKPQVWYGKRNSVDYIILFISEFQNTKLEHTFKNPSKKIKYKTKEHNK
jgi:hypothetical protein